MPITINGSGTVTGISVGGLPDGIVDTDMIANNAIATAKIADNAVTDAKSTISGGKILQVVEATNSTSQATSSASMVNTGLTCTINNVASGSKILVLVNQCMRQYRDRNSGNTMGFGVDLVRTPSGGSSTIILASRKNDGNKYMDFFHNGGDTNNVSLRWPMMKLDTPGTTGTIVYKTMMASGKGSDDYAEIWAQPDFESQTTSPTSTITLMEISS